MASTTPYGESAAANATASPIVATPVLGEAREDYPSRDGDRHDPRRQHEEHRDEYELRRHRRTRADLEVEPERQGVDRNKHQGGDRSRRAFGRQRAYHQEGAGHKGARRYQQRQPFAPRQPVQATRTLLLDDSLGRRVEARRAGYRRNRHCESGNRPFWAHARVRFPRSSDPEREKTPNGVMQN